MSYRELRSEKPMLHTSFGPCLHPTQRVELKEDGCAHAARGALFTDTGLKMTDLARVSPNRFHGKDEVPGLPSDHQYG